uniref:Uncharacterized protein n=1 Tax=Rhizophora mucronata TaxID=61149 RepID=A0A2P2Q466_RHIMU
MVLLPILQASFVAEFTCWLHLLLS